MRVTAMSFSEKSFALTRSSDSAAMRLASPHNRSSGVPRDSVRPADYRIICDRYGGSLHNSELTLGGPSRERPLARHRPESLSLLTSGDVLLHHVARCPL